MGCETIARPFGMLLMLLYDWVNNYGLALILIAVVVRVVLLPFQMKGKRGQLRQTRIQPKIAELQKKYATNKQKLNEEMGKLYKEEGVNPATGCLWNFIQMPIMIGLFFAIRQPLSLMMGVAEEAFASDGIIIQTLERVGVSFTEEMLAGPHAQVEIAQAVSNNWSEFVNLNIPGLQNMSFNMGILDLSQTPDFRVWEFPWTSFSALLPVLLLFFLPVLSGAAQFVSMGINRKMNPQGSPEAAAGTMGKVMKFMPLMSVWFGFILPAALSLYWTVGTALQIGQDIWLTKKYTKILDAEEAERDKERKIKEAEIEAKRIETERKKAEGLIEQSSNTSKKKKKKGKKQGKREKAAEWEKKTAPKKQDKEEKYEPSRVGNRKYARGRAYDPDRYSKGTDEETEESIDSGDDIETIEGIDTKQSTDDSYESSEIEAEDPDDASNDGTVEERDSGDDDDVENIIDEEGKDYSGKIDEDSFEVDDSDDDDDDDDDSDDDDDDDYGDDDGDDDDDDDDSDDSDRVNDYKIKEKAPPTERFGTKRFD